jgi:hypothetical protein
MTPIHVLIAIEDDLSDATLRKLLDQCGRQYHVVQSLGKRGKDYLRSKLSELNKSASGMPIIVLADLDDDVCAPYLRSDWLAAPYHSNLILRVAVREVEAWILAHREAISTFLGVPQELVPDDTERVTRPKEFIIGLASRSRNRSLREDMLPKPGSTAKQGPGYNRRMIEFVEQLWNPERAKMRNDSLLRAAQRLREFDGIA